MGDSPVPETLETIAAKIEALSRSNDERFGRVDQQFTEMRAQLGVKIEAVDTKVDRVYDAVLALQAHAVTNAADHKRFTERLDNHDVRILALESRRRAKR